MSDNLNQIPDFINDFQESERNRALSALEPIERQPETSEPTPNPEDEDIKSPGGLIMFFLKHARVTFLFILAILLTGTFALFNLDIESNPEINQPIALVQTFYPNSSPADVENQVTKVIEEEIVGLSDLKEITSSSSSGLSTVFATFESNADPDEVVADTREAINKVANFLPDDAETPQVIEFDFNNIAVVSLSITGPQTKLELTQLAEEISDQIEKINGVSRVELSGDLVETAKVIVDPVKMEFYGLSLSEISQAIQQNNINAPLGNIDKDKSEVNLRLLGKVQDIEELKQIPIRNLDTEGNLSLITLSQVAEIELSPEDSKTDSYVSNNEEEAQSAVTLNVFKSNGGNIVNIANSIDEEIKKINETLEKGVSIIKTTDNAYYIKSDISTLSVSGIQTMIIIFFALLAFLTIKEAFVAAIAVPLIFLVTFSVIYFTGETLNGLTIFSLILSLGLVVDTSIVIVEGVHEKRIEGLSPFNAAKYALSKFKWPLIAGTATTVAAFIPMLLVSGIVGDFIRTIPIVLSITLSASLVVSFLITPTLANSLLGSKEKAHGGLKDEIVEKLKHTYRSTLETLLHSKALRGAVIAITTVAFLISLSFPVTGILKAQLFPVVDVPFFYINFEAAEGTDLETTREYARDIELELEKLDSVENYVINLGRQVDLADSLSQSAIKSNTGHFVVNLIEDTKQRERSYQITSQLRETLTALNTPLVDISIAEDSAGPPTAAPLEVRITGPEIEQLEVISNQIKTEVEKIDGFINVSTDFDNNSEELQISLDPDILSFYQLSNTQVIQALAAFSTGSKIGELEIKGEDYDLNLYLENTATKTIEELQSFQIQTPSGSVALGSLGQITSSTTIQTIPRIDEERSVRVRASLDEGYIIAQVLPTAEEAINNLKLPTGYSTKIGGEDEDIQQSFTELFSSMIIAVILILVILVMVFNSFRQTFIVMASVPLSVIGIFPGLAILGLPLSFPAFLGVVMLTGIVVNDAIVLMDQINENRQNQMDVKTSIVEGASARLVPILLTSITTIFGLIPITLTDEFWRGLGYSVIFGMLAATFLTLIIIPTLYSFFFRDKQNDSSY